MAHLPSASTKIRAIAGWLVLIVGLSVTCLLFAERLDGVRLPGGEPTIGISTNSATAAFGDAHKWVLLLATGHFLGLCVLWCTDAFTASVPRSLRQVGRLGAAGSLILIGVDFTSTIASLPMLVAHAANLTFWLLVESNRKKGSRWDRPRRTLDPLLSYGTSVAAAVAVMIAVERGQELRSAGTATARVEPTPAVALPVPERDETGDATDDEAAPGGGLASFSLRRSGAPLEMAEQSATPTPGQATSASLEGLFSERIRRVSRAATVRIVNRTEQITGSGTIVFAGPDFACVLTAAHLVRFGDEITVDAFDGDRPQTPRSVVGVQVWGLDPRNDLAMLWVPGEARLEVAMKICPEQSAPADSDVAVLALTSTDSGPPAFYLETVTRRAVRKRATAQPVPIWEGARTGFRGQSGGALMDQQGWLVGVRSGIAGGKAYYAHHAAIHRFLRTNEFYRDSGTLGGPTRHVDLLRLLGDPGSLTPSTGRGGGSSKSSK